MSVVTHKMVPDEHGADHALITFGCDGPDCDRQTVVDARLPIGTEQEFHDWATVLGFDGGNEHFHARECLKAWAATVG